MSRNPIPVDVPHVPLSQMSPSDVEKIKSLKIILTSPKRGRDGILFSVNERGVADLCDETWKYWNAPATELFISADNF